MDLLKDRQAVVDTFIRAYAYLQYSVSGTTLTGLGDLMHLHFGKAFDGITDEYFAVDQDPDRVVQAIRQAEGGAAHWLTVFTDFPEETQAAYLGRGYDTDQAQFLMGRRLEGIQLSRSSIPIHRAARLGEIEAINQARGFRVIYPGFLTDRRVEVYYAGSPDNPAAWGSALLVGDDTIYLANMYTVPAFRRQGFGSALLSTILVDAAEGGVKRCILVSSNSGHRLYQKHGFADLWNVEVFTSIPA
jgi:ribosomal protein S18 acetylase RimI-like enzyme